MEEKIKCFRLLLEGREFDELYFDASDGTWKAALDAVETELDAQFLDGRDWSDISVTIQCCELDRNTYDEIFNDE